MVISIIIPVFNRRDDLRRCLKSIRFSRANQGEIIVVDDHSSEPLHDLCAENVVYVRNPFNLGPSYSRNLAALSAKGSILLFLDSDVELLPGTLASIETILQQNQDIACVGGSGPSAPGGRDVAYVKVKFYDKAGQNQSLERHENDFPVSGCIDCDHFESACMAIRATTFREIGGFDPYWFYMGEDRELCLRLRRAGHRVTVSWHARAIHHDRGVAGKQRPSFRSFLASRFFEVAYKHDGLIGAFRWLWSNRTEFCLLPPLQPMRIISRAYMLRKRRGQNFLQPKAMENYIEYVQRSKCRS